MPDSFDAVDRLCVNTIRTLSIDMIQKANSGHPGLPMGAAPMAWVLWTRHLKHNPADPSWPDRDRFVLSAGHGSAMLYSLLHLTGYDLSMDDLKSFRQWGSRTPGHPEWLLTPGVEATTGPLGQGTANAVGMAIAEKWLADRYNRDGHVIVDHFTWALVSDGDLMEGISAEASSLAGHLRLGKLIFLYDSNDISLDGPTSMAFSGEDVLERYEAYGWQTLGVENGDEDLDAIDAAISEAKADTSRPSIIEIKTTIGYGSPHKAGTSAAHGSPLGEEEVVLAKKQLGWEWPETTFRIPDQAIGRFREAIKRGADAQKAWNDQFEKYEAECPELAHEWLMALEGMLPDDWDRGLPNWNPGEMVSTRVAAGTALCGIAARIPWLVGGDADLSSSTKSRISNAGWLEREGTEPGWRNIHFGVREHAMGGIVNGVAYHGGIRPFCSTFFVFSDYMRPSVRLAAMNGLSMVYLWTHDSIGVGEDGPTHQPIEHLASLRAIPNLAVIRPADATEAVWAWIWAVRRNNMPVVLVLSRQDLPVIDRGGHLEPSEHLTGAYVLADPPDGNPVAIIIASGSEVHIALEARDILEKEGVATRVVSMPCWEAFEEMDEEYKESVLPSEIKARVSVEAGATFGWRRWIGEKGIAIGIDRFGASAPGPVVAENYGMTAENVVNAVRECLRLVNYSP